MPSQPQALANLASGQYTVKAKMSQALDFHKNGNLLTKLRPNSEERKKVVDFSAGGNPTVPASLVAKVRALPDVQEAAGTIVDLSGNNDQVKLLDRTGKVITASGNPTFGFGIDPDAQRFNAFQLKTGRWASGASDVVIDADTSAKYHFNPGDSIRVVGTGRIRTSRVVGVAKFGDLNSLGGATIAIFAVPTVRTLLSKQGYDSISVAAKPGIAPEYLAG